MLTAIAKHADLLKIGPFSELPSSFASAGYAELPQQQPTIRSVFQEREDSKVLPNLRARETSSSQRGVQRQSHRETLAKHLGQGIQRSRSRQPGTCRRRSNSTWFRATSLLLRQERLAQFVAAHAYDFAVGQQHEAGCTENLRLTGQWRRSLVHRQTGNIEVAHAGRCRD